MIRLDFASPEEAAAAVGRYEGVDYEGTPLCLRHYPNHPGYLERLVVVTGLPDHVDWANLRVTFEAIGQVVSTNVIRELSSASARFGYVLMGTTWEAARAIKLLAGTEHWGQTIEVKRMVPVMVSCAKEVGAWEEED